MKRDHFNDWIESIDTKNLWNAHRFTLALITDGAKVRILTLKKTSENGWMIEIQNNEGKSKLLHKAFFHQLPANSGIDPNYQYPQPTFSFGRITDEEIKRAIRKQSPYKAPGPNKISNSILTHCIDELMPYLGPIY